MLGTLKYRHCVNEHEHCEYDEVKTGKRFRCNQLTNKNLNGDAALDVKDNASKVVCADLP